MVAFRLSWPKDLCSVPQCCMFLAWLLPPCREPPWLNRGAVKEVPSIKLDPNSSHPNFTRLKWVLTVRLTSISLPPWTIQLWANPWYPYVDFHMAMDVHPMHVVCRSFPGVLTVIVKAGCLFEVVSLSGKFGDPAQRAFFSSVFEGSLAFPMFSSFQR